MNVSSLVAGAAALLGTVGRFLGGLNWNPMSWDAQPWSLLALILAALLLLSLLLRRRRPKRLEPPELFISAGEIAPAEDAEDATPRAAYLLSMNVSNLNSYPVQLLEVALESDEVTDEPIVAELPALLGAETSLQLSQRIPKIVVGSGTLSLYLYIPAQAQRPAQYFQHRATFEWSLWQRRYRVSPLRQLTQPVKGPADTKLNQERQTQWRQRPESRPEQESAGEPKLERPEAEAAQPKTEGGLRFPDDF
jgi:hypothetical protein